MNKRAQAADFLVLFWSIIFLAILGIVSLLFLNLVNTDIDAVEGEMEDIDTFALAKDFITINKFDVVRLDSDENFGQILSYVEQSSFCVEYQSSANLIAIGNSKIRATACDDLDIEDDKSYEFEHYQNNLELIIYEVSS